jgi:selenide, water dikinase
VITGVADDAGVYKLRDDLAIVETVDLIAPIEDDPYTFGMIAATNCLSDIYAKGGRPVTAMNIVAFPSETVDMAILRKILQGALAKLTEAGVALVGGHSVRNEDIKFGLSVTGVIHPDKVIKKTGVQAGDRLILTKPLGTGILATAAKAEMLPPGVRQRLAAQMTKLNDKASQAMVRVGAHACTDITGFGLLGHVCEMIEDSGLSVELAAGAVPVIPEAWQFARMGLIPAGMYDNQKFRASMVEAAGINEDMMAIFYDPQTSGGLLIATARAEAMLTELRALGVTEAVIIGQVVRDTRSRVKVL